MINRRYGIFTIQRAGQDNEAHITHAPAFPSRPRPHNPLFVDSPLTRWLKLCGMQSTLC